MGGGLPPFGNLKYKIATSTDILEDKNTIELSRCYQYTYYYEVPNVKVDDNTWQEPTLITWSCELADTSEFPNKYQLMKNCGIEKIVNYFENPKTWEKSVYFVSGRLYDLFIFDAKLNLTMFYTTLTYLGNTNDYLKVF